MVTRDTVAVGDMSRRLFMQTAGRFALVTVGGTAILAACSKNKAPAGGSSSSGSAELTPMAMQLAWVSDAEFLGYFIALEKGYYKAEGLDFSPLPGGPQVAPESVLVSGKAMVALTTPDTTANVIVKEQAPLKIIGAQYQKNPIGIMSLPASNINTPQDLIGKTVGVPSANQLTMAALLKVNNIDPSQVHIVPYSFDPTPVATGEIDAAIAFVTTDPYLLQDKGVKSSWFVLSDYGVELYNDTVVVTEDDLANHHDEIVGWFRASIRGWQDAINDTANRNEYIKLITDKYGKSLGQSAASQTFQMNAQVPLMTSTVTDQHGLFWMDPADISANVDTIKRLGIDATADMFTTSVLEEVYQGGSTVSP